jgi:hypothetical protein
MGQNLNVQGAFAQATARLAEDNNRGGNSRRCRAISARAKQRSFQSADCGHFNGLVGFWKGIPERVLHRIVNFLRLGGFELNGTGFTPELDPKYQIIEGLLLNENPRALPPRGSPQDRLMRPEPPGRPKRQRSADLP